MSVCAKAIVAAKKAVSTPTQAIVGPIQSLATVRTGLTRTIR